MVGAALNSFLVSDIEAPREDLLCRGMDAAEVDPDRRSYPASAALPRVMAALLAMIGVAGATPVFAQAATPFLPLANEPPPRLFVDPPIPDRLAAGAVLIPYRTENFRILPVLGEGALGVSPRAGHLHVTVDDLPWRWADASDTRTVVVVGMPPGPHKIRIELADPTHHVITGQTVTFVVPPVASREH